MTHNRRAALATWLGGVVVHAVLVLALVTVGVFLIVRLVPGDPAQMVLGLKASPAQIADLRHRLGLDQSIGRQFVSFVTTLVTTGDTGESIAYHVSSRALVLDRLPVSLWLVGCSAVLVVAISLPLAMTAALHKGSWIDQLVRVVPTVTLGMPEFWVGLVFVLVFAVTLRIFPVGGTQPGIDGMLYSMALPSLTIALAQTPFIVRSLRTRILEVLGADFVTTLRAAGLSRRAIRRHVLRNALLPALQLYGMKVSFLIGGTLVVEQVFGLRGVGSLLFAAITARDFPLIQAVAMYCALGVVLVSTLVRLAGGLIDYRVREGGAR
ncbi:ABC transporter permease [Bifidobacterium saguinibicoloris]|uniref:ABC transporter permease n=1 Tax=Bifidobacterium saguinibicoloris TaxID=2834433 RepID=UPI001C5748A8|nr:ABC transporter permease [Bifidobacterium saguinibicoloris]MBW3080167.1 ABC transporter permease [Bifidobacterium saguinibicoloris]